VSTCLVVVTDGRRDCLAQTMRSATEALGLATFDERIIVNDSIDHDYGRWLELQFGGGFRILHPDAGKRGFAGAVQAGWAAIRAIPRAELVFWLEDDFTFNAPLDLTAIAQVLDQQQHLAQIVLKRQPWSTAEIAAGGIVEMHPDDYIERTDGARVWTEHRRFWSTNPSMFRADTCWRDWPAGRQSEGIFTHELLADADTRFAFWGAKHAEPLVTHIGDIRAGHGY
jgi:hypothetical protein